MRKVQYKKVATILAIAGAIIGALAVSNIRVELDEEQKGVRTVQGNMVGCDIERLSNSSSMIFLGITLDSSDKIFRMNPPKKKRNVYVEMCNAKPKVSIKYHAVKRLVGPIRFWIDNIDEI